MYHILHKSSNTILMPRVAHRLFLQHSRRNVLYTLWVAFLLLPELSDFFKTTEANPSQPLLCPSIGYCSLRYHNYFHNPFYKHYPHNDLLMLTCMERPFHMLRKIVNLFLLPAYRVNHFQYSFCTDAKYCLSILLIDYPSACVCFIFLRRKISSDVTFTTLPRQGGVIL